MSGWETNSAVVGPVGGAIIHIVIRGTKVVENGTQVSRVQFGQIRKCLCPANGHKVDAEGFVDTFLFVASSIPPREEDLQ